MFFNKKRRFADAQYLILGLEVIVQNAITSPLTVTFSAYASVCLEFFLTVTTEIILTKKAIVQFSQTGS